MWTVTVEHGSRFIHVWLGAKKLLARIIVLLRKAVQKLFGGVYISLRIKELT